MKQLSVISLEKDQYERLMKRYHLFFYIDQFNQIHEFSDTEEKRDATGPEVFLWNQLIPERLRLSINFNMNEAIDSTIEELESSLTGDQTYTISSSDVAVMLSSRMFNPCIDTKQLKMGLIGWFNASIIYCSRLIPKGYFYEGKIEKWSPSSDKREIEPQVSDELKFKIENELKPIINRR